MKLRRYETMKHMMHDAQIQERSLNAGMHTGSENHLQSMGVGGACEHTAGAVCTERTLRSVPRYLQYSIVQLRSILVMILKQHYCISLAVCVQQREP